MEKIFNKEPVMTKEDKENFNICTTKCWACDNDYIDNDIKMRDHYLINGKYRCSAYRDCNINLKFNQKILIVFDNLKIMILILLCKNQANSVL